MCRGMPGKRNNVDPHVGQESEVKATSALAGVRYMLNAPLLRLTANTLDGNYI